MKDRSELLKKLKALADKGVGGEATNAEALLQKFMLKYGVTEEELYEDERQQYEFAYWGVFGEDLLNQIAYSILGNNYNCYKYVHKRNKIRLITCTLAEKIEIEEAFLFYRGVLDEGIHKYCKAFIHAEGIFPSEPTDDIDIPRSKPDMDVVKLASVMDKHPRRHLIEDGSNK